ncbi:MAG: type IV pili twitching motility protein PilT [candidate division NC10 bacterium RIFCSPLOWO2_12_FULL_66_18]|nr:MAG: type IV pili twitching motility protein PilT [candidate division NC10 bacterium RIFCSPLOWO2_02_FULL_66_22]OGB99641.1 MAG: type IV pili twitching motility protein PilT [candidate division NC10 bacterium RIFCSPLOWO2_12_FULL_66_18]
MELPDLLKIAVERKASDLHIKVGSPPVLRIDDKLVPLMEMPRLGQDAVVTMAASLMNAKQREKFKERSEIDLAYSMPGLGRFRANVFQQRGTVGLVLRVIPIKIQNISELNLPPVLEKVAMEPRGLILVTGTTGSGKSSTLASMIDYINSSRSGHILTIEDPIEFLHRDKKCLVNQREIGVDTPSFSEALRSALRQDPDIILVGEMRDYETISTAILAAETGHLVMSTLHTLDATETINRIISVFPPYQQKQTRLQLAAVLKGIIAQRLIPRADGKGRVPAVEVCIATATVRECVVDPDKTRKLNDAIAAGVSQYGMQTFDQSLMSLYTRGLISYEEALHWCSNADDFALRVRGVESTADATWQGMQEAPKTVPGMTRF